MKYCDEGLSGCIDSDWDLGSPKINRLPTFAIVVLLFCWRRMDRTRAGKSHAVDQSYPTTLYRIAVRWMTCCPYCRRRSTLSYVCHHLIPPPSFFSALLVVVVVVVVATSSPFLAKRHLSITIPRALFQDHWTSTWVRAVSTRMMPPCLWYFLRYLFERHSQLGTFSFAINYYLFLKARKFFCSLKARIFAFCVQSTLTYI